MTLPATSFILAGWLNWQQRLILLVVLPAAGVYAAIQLSNAASLRPAAQAAAFAVVLGATVLAARAATFGAALLGMLLAFCYGIAPSYPHSALWPLTATLVLTLGASRVGRARKRSGDEGETTRGRDAVQVAANLGAGVLACAALNRYGALAAHTAVLAALAELTADTLGSELGQLSRQPPRMLLTGRIATPGVDGAISLPGSAAALIGALLVTAIGMWAFALPLRFAAVSLACGFAGMLFDSVLGQLLEQRRLLGNDAVNFLSCLTAMLAALWLGTRV